MSKRLEGDFLELFWVRSCGHECGRLLNLAPASFPSESYYAAGSCHHGMVSVRLCERRLILIVHSDMGLISVAFLLTRGLLLASLS